MDNLSKKQFFEFVKGKSDKMMYAALFSACNHVEITITYSWLIESDFEDIDRDLIKKRIEELKRS